MAKSRVSSPLGVSFLAYVRSRTDTVSAAVYDDKRGDLYTYNPNLSYMTASLMKVAMLAYVLHQTERTHKPLSSDTRDTLTNMIEQSDNDSATDVWDQIGRGKMIDPFFRAVGMRHTVARTDDYWGLTSTTALDQIALLKLFAFHNSVIDDADRWFGLQLMKHVVSGQRWGVPSGVPSGVSIALKNGWSPYVSDNWRINSIGIVSGKGRTYLIAVLSFHNPTESYGVETVNRVSGIVAHYFYPNR